MHNNMVLVTYRYSTAYIGVFPGRVQTNVHHAMNDGLDLACFFDNFVGELVMLTVCIQSARI